MSVRKRIWTTSKGEQREAFVVDYRDQNGDRALQTFEKKGDAVSFWAQVKKAVDEGNHVAPSKSETVALAAERWIKSVQALGRERTTVQQYRQHIDLHIVPKIGGLKVATLTEARLEKFRDDLLAKVSRAMARKLLTSVKSILRTAKRSQVAANVKIPRDKRKRKLEIGKNIPAPQEITRLLKAAGDQVVAAAENAVDKRRAMRCQAMTATATFTGLRASELRGLRWGDIDFAQSKVHVRQRADKYKAIGAPKSESSSRTLDLPPKLLALLKEWKLACPKGEGDLVFPSEKGVVADHKTLLRSLDRVMEEAGLMTGKGDAAEPKYGLHSLRHYFASWCINPKSAGGRELPPKNVQQLMGHSSIVITLDTYGHLFPRGDNLAELAEAEAKLWGA